jgi:hypothetical protein
MDPKSAAQVIRDSVTMEQIISLYGYKTKHGFMVCPFHGDKDASLKVYPGSGGWHCFGCGKGGSVVDFVMEHEGCDFRTAVVAIDKAMHMGLADPHEDAYRTEIERKKQEWLDQYVGAINAYCDALKAKIECDLRMNLARVKEIEMMKQAGQMEKLTAADFDFLHMWKETSEFDEYRLEKIENFREEVAAWRREWRRAK